MSDDPEVVEVTLEDDKKMPENEPEVEIVDEASAKPEKVEKSSEIAPEEGINELKRKLEIEQLARVEAERRAREAQLNAQKAKDETIEAQYQMVSNAIDTLKGRSQALQNAYAEALNVGDHAKAAEINNAMVTNENQLEKLKEGKKAMKKQLKDAEDASSQQQQQPVQHGDVVDQLISSVAPSSPKSAMWLHQNRSLIRSETDVRKMFRAHEDAIDDGIRPDSDEYFKFIESRLTPSRRYESPQNEATPESPLSSAAAPKRTPQPPPAPVSRGGQRPNVVRLSREQADMAKMMGMTESDYAKQMVALQKEGKLGH